MKISFVIPVFRNEGALLLTYQKLKKLFEQQLQNKYLYEIIFVNDGSDDNSINELLEIKNLDRQVKIISFSRNFGQVPAIIAGFKESTGDCVVNMSADLQDPPELIIQMLQAWEQKNEIVICYRNDREDNFIANNTSKLFYGLMKYVNPKMPVGGFDFLLLDRKPVNEFNKIDERNRFFQGDILWLGYTIKFIPYKRQKRVIGKSQWSLSKKLKYFIDGLLNTSYIPIRLMSFLGIITAFVGFLYSLIIIYARIVHKTPFTGWAPIMIITLIIGGVIMIMLGIIGEYIWRIYDEARNRPIYIIKDKFID
jgi:dolichol-phosphate mannosyltransferase